MIKTTRVIISYPDEKGGTTVLDVYVKRGPDPLADALDLLEEYKDRIQGPVKVAVHLHGRKWRKFQGDVLEVIENIKEEVRP